MSRIKPVWRIVLGFLFLMAVVYNSSMLAFGGSFAGFAVMAALFVVYVVFAIRVPYDDPLRSMRDLMARQAEQAEQERGPDTAAVVSGREASLVETTIRQAQRITELEREVAELRARLGEK